VVCGFEVADVFSERPVGVVQDFDASGTISENPIGVSFRILKRQMPVASGWSTGKEGYITE